MWCACCFQSQHETYIRSASADEKSSGDMDLQNYWQEKKNPNYNDRHQLWPAGWSINWEGGSHLCLILNTVCSLLPLSCQIVRLQAAGKMPTIPLLTCLHLNGESTLNSQMTKQLFLCCARNVQSYRTFGHGPICDVMAGVLMIHNTCCDTLALRGAVISSSSSCFLCDSELLCIDRWEFCKYTNCCLAES